MADSSSFYIADAQRFLRQRRHHEFLEAIDVALTAVDARDRDVVATLAGEGLALLVGAEPAGEVAVYKKYFDLVRAGGLIAPPGTLSAVVREVIPRIKDLLGEVRMEDIVTDFLFLTDRAERQVNSRPKPPNDQNVSPTIELTNIVQRLLYQPGRYAQSDALGLKESIYKSPQERSFGQALKIRFPGLEVHPNYPFSQFVNWERLQAIVDGETWSYASRCILDAVLTVPVEGDVIAAFELDSSHHDTYEAKAKDERKDRLLDMIGVPLVRLRAEDPRTISAEEWYRMLTDHVLDKIDCGFSLRTRQHATTLVPLARRR